MSKIEDYMEHEIWITKAGYFRAYDSSGKPFGPVRVSIDSIKKIIRDSLSTMTGEKI